MSFDAPASVPDPDSVAADPVDAGQAHQAELPPGAEPSGAEPPVPQLPAAEPPVPQLPVPQSPAIEQWAAPGAGEFLPPPAGGDAGGTPVFPPPPASSLFSVPRGRRPPKPPKRLVIATCGLVVVGLVAGLLVWAPWNPSPNAPASVSAQSKTATTVTVSWPAAIGGARPANYVVLRDGKQAGAVPASETSWTDRDLAPGSAHQYAVETVGGGQTSGPSVIARVTTLAPSPVGLTVTANYSQATLHWKPSPLGPAPSKYTIYNGSAEVMALPGTTTTYTDGEDGAQKPGQAFKYSVVAQWGGHKSRPSAPAVGSILSPPLNSGVQVQVKPTYVPSGATGATVGTTYSYSWSFQPVCEANACTMTVAAKIPAAGGKYLPIQVSLVSDGAGYSGSFSRAKLSECSTVGVSGAIKITLTPDKGEISNGAWGGWTGTVVLSTPYASVGGGYYCPASNWDFSLSGNGQRGIAQPT
jgi:hypothetical protein